MIECRSTSAPAFKRSLAADKPLHQHRQQLHASPSLITQNVLRIL